MLQSSPWTQPRPRPRLAKRAPCKPLRRRERRPPTRIEWLSEFLLARRMLGPRTDPRWVARNSARAGPPPRPQARAFIFMLRIVLVVTLACLAGVLGYYSFRITRDAEVRLVRGPTASRRTMQAFHPFVSATWQLNRLEALGVSANKSGPCNRPQFEQSYESEIRVLSSAVERGFLAKKRSAQATATAFVFPPGGRATHPDFSARASLYRAHLLVPSPLGTARAASRRAVGPAFFFSHRSRAQSDQEPLRRPLSSARSSRPTSSRSAPAAASPSLRSSTPNSARCASPNISDRPPTSPTTPSARLTLTPTLPHSRPPRRTRSSSARTGGPSSARASTSSPRRP